MTEAEQITPTRLPREAVFTALRDAVAVATPPRVAWVAGLLVPVFGYSPQLDARQLTVADAQGVISPFDGVEFALGQDTLSISVVALGLALLWMRLQAQVTAGLLLEADRATGHLDQKPDPNDEPSLDTIWKRAEPVAGDCFGVLAARYTLGMLAIATILVVPTTIAANIGGISPTFAPLVWPLVALLAVTVFLYVAVIEVATHIALVSCVHNGRGPVSGLQHAWRLMRAEPAAATRAGLGHFGLLAGVLILQGIAGSILGGFGFILALALAGAGGVARLAYWERVFDALGGWRTATPPPHAPDDRSSKDRSKAEPTEASKAAAAPAH